MASRPLGSGFLAQRMTNLADGDFRHNLPRFKSENVSRNVDRFAAFRKLAAELGVTSAQLALAWLLHQGTTSCPFPARAIPHICAVSAV